MVNEVINYRTQKMTTKQGNQAIVVYIDSYTSENMYAHKDILKKYEAKWDGRYRRWYWVLSTDEEKRQWQMQTFIEPCIRELNAVEDNGKPAKTGDEEIQALKELISALDIVINSKIETTDNFTPGDVEAVKNKLMNFKKDLLRATTDEEFRQRFEPVLQQVIEGGFNYSILNTLLMMIQDPKATYVYPKGKWNKLNRYVDTAHGKPICMWTPIQDEKERYQFIKKWLAEHGKTTKDVLTPDEEREMYDDMKVAVPFKGWSLKPYFYDVRFTKVMKGKKDLAVFKRNGVHMVNQKSGNENGDLKWFDENTPETEESKRIYDALINVIQNMGIKLAFVNNIGGSDARGVSKGGYIDILKDAPKNIGTCNTLIHELSHEIFHHQELQGMDNAWKKFYLGRGDRHLVEQQAELCAWIVMRFLGYDMKTNINYIGNWGINEENAAKVFDQVANAADKITKLLFAELNKMPETVPQEQTLNESMIKESITGLDVASMLGDDFKKLYLKSKQRQQTTLEEESNKLNESFRRICGIEL